MIEGGKRKRLHAAIRKAKDKRRKKHATSGPCCAAIMVPFLSPSKGWRRFLFGAGENIRQRQVLWWVLLDWPQLPGSIRGPRKKKAGGFRAPGAHRHSDCWTCLICRNMNGETGILVSVGWLKLAWCTHEPGHRICGLNNRSLIAVAQMIFRRQSKFSNGLFFRLPRELCTAHVTSSHGNHGIVMKAA